MSNDKSHDEIFCRSCGETIKKKAEICPNCGVRNEYQEGQSTEHTQQRTSHPESNHTTSEPVKETHDPSNYSTTVADNWYYGVAASLVLWIFGFALPEGSAIAGLFFLVAWGLMPVSIYFDHQWLRASTEWKPNLVLWVTVAAIPLVNIIGGGVYLFRRYNTADITPAKTTNDQQASGDGALDQLRERYSKGELTDEEFETKLEQIVGTEDKETAKMHIRNQSNDSSDMDSAQEK